MDSSINFLIHRHNCGEKMTAVVEIPDDVVVEILARLPVKSLLRFRCICKLWRSIISDSSFIELHRTLSVTRAGGNLFLLCFPSVAHWPWRLLFYIDHSEEEGRCNAFRNDFSLSGFSECINGLICQDDPQPQVCNLSTKERVILPTTAMDFPKWIQTSSHCSLGFEPRNNTYKILRTWKVYWSSLDWSPRFEIFTLGSNTWRSLIPESNISVPGNRHSVCVGGTMYWNNLREKNVVAFDVAEERFRLVPSPCRTIHSAIVQLDGRVAMVNYHGLVDGGDSMRVWVLEDDRNGTWSMEKKIVFPSIWRDVKRGMPSFCHLIFETTHGAELVFFPQSESSEKIYVVYYDIERRRMRFKSLVKPEMYGVGCPPSVCNYVESLVSLREIINPNNS